MLYGTRRGLVTSIELTQVLGNCMVMVNLYVSNEVSENVVALSI